MKIVLRLVFAQSLALPASGYARQANRDEELWQTLVAVRAYAQEDLAQLTSLITVTAVSFSAVGLTGAYYASSAVRAKVPGLPTIGLPVMVATGVAIWGVPWGVNRLRVGRGLADRGIQGTKLDARTAAPHLKAMREFIFLPLADQYELAVADEPLRQYLFDLRYWLEQGPLGHAPPRKRSWTAEPRVN